MSDQPLTPREIVDLQREAVRLYLSSAFRLEEANETHLARLFPYPPEPNVVQVEGETYWYRLTEDCGLEDSVRGPTGPWRSTIVGNAVFPMLVSWHENHRRAIAAVLAQPVKS